MTQHVVLVGLMGAGKTTVGELLARRWRRDAVDLDAVIEQRAGLPVAAIFERDGEAGFRSLERETLADLLAGSEPLVLSAGGGVITTPEARTLLQGAAATTVWLQVAPETAAARVGEDPNRPMLAGGALANLRRLHEERAPHYAEVATVAVDSTGHPEQVAERIVGLLRARAGEVPPEPTRLRVELGERSYPVLVGPGCVSRLGEVLPAGTRRVAVVTQAGIEVAVDPGVEHRTYVIGDGEPAKSIATVEDLCRQWAQWGMSRADAVVAVGGGVVTDVAGFAAAVFHRGIPVVHVSTTLLGQIDAAIGGKTGVNLPEGKNLVGAFWQPAAVVCDTDTLAGLPEREYRSGMGELAKYHFLGGGALDRLPLPERVAAAVAIKADVVSGDEREGGRRAILNYGHTLAHALETAGSYDLRHGEAVAIGLRFAARLGWVLGRIDDARVAEHDRVVRAYGLVEDLPAGVDRDELIDLMGRDKKALTGLTFVLDGDRGVEVVTGISRDALHEAFDAMTATEAPR